MTSLLLLFLFQAKGSISGTVVDSVSSLPIRKAQIRLANFPANPIVTDASGSFLFDQVPPGIYSISAAHPEFPQGQTPSAAQTTIQLAAGERRSGVELKLTPTATLAGQVLDEDGDPLPNCSVSLFLNTHHSMLVFQAATTGYDGRYDLRPVPPGKYYLEAHCFAPVLQPRPFLPAHVRTPGTLLGYRARFYPGTLNLAGAQRLNLAAGQTVTGLNFQMLPEALSSLTVHVTGVAAPRINATLTPDDGAPQRQIDTISASMTRTGEVSFQSVPAGRYILRLSSSTPEHMLLSKQPVTVGDEPAEISLTVTPPIPLNGILRRTESADPAPTRISLTQDEEPGVHLESNLRSDGAFAFRGVSPGHYRVLPFGSEWIQSVSVGGERTDGPEFELKPGASGPVEIVTGAERGSVSGEIDLASAHPSKITLIMTFSHTQAEWSDALIAPSRYSAKLPPGKYRIYAVEIPANSDFASLLDHESIASRGEAVEIRPGVEIVKNLKLITAQEIEAADR